MEIYPFSTRQELIRGNHELYNLFEEENEK